MLSGLRLLYTAAPSDRLAAVRIEGIKGSGHRDVKGSMFPLFQLRTSTTAGGWVWLWSGVRPLPNSTLKVGMMTELNKHVTLIWLWQVTKTVLQDKGEEINKPCTLYSSSQ